MLTNCEFPTYLCWLPKLGNLSVFGRAIEGQAIQNDEGRAKKMMMIGTTALVCCLDDTRRAVVRVVLVGKLTD